MNFETTTTTISDGELIDALQAGQASVFHVLYARHHKNVYRYCLMRCGKAEFAADICQDVFMALLQNKIKYNALLGKLEHFLFGVARNYILKYEEKNQRYQAFPSLGIGFEDEDGILDNEEIAPLKQEPLSHLLNQKLAEQLRQALALLPAHYRDVFILFELQEVPYQDIAQICNINIGTVRSRLSRARQFLAQQLSKQNK
jgi:RNA polymerase sigma-70 factor (ECF subfamily)